MAEKLIVYDSFFGNTAKVAEAIDEVLGDAILKKPTEITSSDLHDLKILIVGSPTRAFRPTPEILKFLKGLDHNTMVDVKAAAFDTRFPLNKTDSGFLRLMIKMFGYAAEKINKALSKTGANIALEAAGFAVEGTEGPLTDGELERAKAWTNGLLN